MSDTSSRELSQWARYYQTEPWGIEPFDHLFSQLCCVVAKCMGNANVQPKDFLLFQHRTTRKPKPDLKTIRRWKEQAKALTRAMNRGQNRK